VTLFNNLHMKFDNFYFHLYLILFFALAWCKYSFVGGEEMKLCGSGYAPRSSFNMPRLLIRLDPDSMKIWRVNNVFLDGDLEGMGCGLYDVA
jgi:hypothetical protein